MLISIVIHTNDSQYVYACVEHAVQARKGTQWGKIRGIFNFKGRNIEPPLSYLQMLL